MDLSQLDPAMLRQLVEQAGTGYQGGGDADDVDAGLQQAMQLNAMLKQMMLGDGSKARRRCWCWTIANSWMCH